MNDSLRNISIILATCIWVSCGERDSVAASQISQDFFEHTFVSHKHYPDPFNGVDVDVVFSKGDVTWRVPTFWRGGNKWTVRFRAPTAGVYKYHLEATDLSNHDLNGQETRVQLSAYSGSSIFIKRGFIEVSKDGRHFEQSDGTPFYWLGDTWWTGLSDRLSWVGFQELAADRKAKGFTVVQIVAGLVPSNEEQAPIDPGFRNEGGPVWDRQFKQINPRYFDFADRRVQLLIDKGIAPAVVGAWRQALAQMGIAKMKKHWRYIIARYAVYPVFWVVGGELFDPPAETVGTLPVLSINGVPTEMKSPGWSEIAQYIHDTDPYHHPVTAHELPPPYDTPLQNESFTDFDLSQPSHMGWPSIAVEVAQLGLKRSRSSVTKPEVVGEIGYEGIGGTNLQDFQRAAFWLAMLNGAAGYTYGANPIFEAYSTNKPFQRTKYTLMTWKEGMNLPGAYQVGMGARLLQQYPWWRIEPHPEWVGPRGTTLLGLNDGQDASRLGGLDTVLNDPFPRPSGSLWSYPAGEWQKQGGNEFLPYSAGIPGELRFVYIPCFSLFCSTPPTIFGLEPDTRYHAFYWEPVLGVKFDLGMIERPHPGAMLFSDNFENDNNAEWTAYSGKAERSEGQLIASPHYVAMPGHIKEKDVSVAVDIQGNADAELLLRYLDRDNFVEAVYSHSSRTVYLRDRRNGVDGAPLGSMPTGLLESKVRLSAEMKGKWGIVSVSDGHRAYSSRIIGIKNISPGGVALGHQNDSEVQEFDNFEVRKAPTTDIDSHLQKKLYDSEGHYRGELTGEGWEEFGRYKTILLDAYLPDPLPMPQDWILVLENAR